MATAEKRTTSLYIDEAAGTDEVLYVTPPGLSGEWYLNAAKFVPDTAVTADATDYVTLAVLNGSTSLGSIATSSTGFTAGTARAFTLSGGKSREFTGGTDYPKVTVTNTGTAGAACRGNLHLEWVQYS